MERNKKQQSIERNLSNLKNKANFNLFYVTQKSGFLLNKFVIESLLKKYFDNQSTLKVLDPFCHNKFPIYYLSQKDNVIITAYNITAGFSSIIRENLDDYKKDIEKFLNIFTTNIHSKLQSNQSFNYIITCYSLSMEAFTDDRLRRILSAILLESLKDFFVDETVGVLGFFHIVEKNIKNVINNYLFSNMNLYTNSLYHTPSDNNHQQFNFVIFTIPPFGIFNDFQSLNYYEIYNCDISQNDLNEMKNLLLLLPGRSTKPNLSTNAKILNKVENNDLFRLYYHALKDNRFFNYNFFTRYIKDIITYLDLINKKVSKNGKIIIEAKNIEINDYICLDLSYLIGGIVHELGYLNKLVFIKND